MTLCDPNRLYSTLPRLLAIAPPKAGAALLPRTERARRPPKAENRAHIPRAIASREAMLWQGCSLSPRELERKAPRSVWATQLPASRPIRWIVRESREANRTDFARIPSDGLRDAPRASIERTRPLFIGQTSLALPRVNRTDSHSESPRPLSQGRISPALGRPTPIQPFLNPDWTESTATQPRLNHPTYAIPQLRPSNSYSTM